MSIVDFIFYRAGRLGKGGEPIVIYKFRTMKIGAEKEHDSVIQANGLNRFGKVNNDPRVTRLGKFLRKYWLDEIPQIFINWFLKRDLDFVGVRPCSEEEWQNLYSPEHRELALRHRPGLLGVKYSGKPKTLAEAVQIEKQFLQEVGENPARVKREYFVEIVRNAWNGLRSE